MGRQLPKEAKLDFLLSLRLMEIGKGFTQTKMANVIFPHTYQLR
jgi:hypothetical protein